MSFIYIRLLAKSSPVAAKHGTPELVAFRFFERVASGPPCGQVLSHMGLLSNHAPARHIDGCPPRQQAARLEAARRSGVDIRAASDAVVLARIAACVRPSSALTYKSHWSGILCMCKVLGCPGIGPSAGDVRAVLANVNSASTQRGLLPAWKLAHFANTLPFPGQGDPLLKAVLKGSSRLNPPRPARRRLRGVLLLKLVRRAMKHDWWQWMVTTVIGYVFLLRMPSEFWKQFRPSLLGWCPRRHEWSYGPIRRKSKDELQMIFRECTCSSMPELCMCTWSAVLKQAGWLSSQAFWQSKLHFLLSEEGICTQGYTSHVLRRGAAADVLQVAGFSKMCRVGGWQDPRSAFVYTPQAEVEMRSIAQLQIDQSDSD